MQVDGQRGIDLIAGGKGAGAAVGWFQAPVHPRQLETWRWHPWHSVGWLMSLVAEDIDGNGRLDIVYSDRKGPSPGCYWLENSGSKSEERWRRHVIGALGREVMFLDLADLDGDGLRDVIVAAKPNDILFLRRTSAERASWESHAIQIPSEAGSAKAVAVGDINLDGRLDLVFSCEGASDGKHGLMWLAWRESPFEKEWQPRILSGRDGVKYDLVKLLDLDSDGDLDVVTCEETKGLGLIWHENPFRNSFPSLP